MNDSIYNGIMQFYIFKITGEKLYKIINEKNETNDELINMLLFAYDPIKEEIVDTKDFFLTDTEYKEDYYYCFYVETSDDIIKREFHETGEVIFFNCLDHYLYLEFFENAITNGIHDFPFIPQNTIVSIEWYKSWTDWGYENDSSIDIYPIDVYREDLKTI
jgi:hypothetical protein